MKVMSESYTKSHLKIAILRWEGSNTTQATAPRTIKLSEIFAPLVIPEFLLHLVIPEFSPHSSFRNFCPPRHTGIFSLLVIPEFRFSEISGI